MKKLLLLIPVLCFAACIVFVAQMEQSAPAVPDGAAPESTPAVSGEPAAGTPDTPGDPGTEVPPAVPLEGTVQKDQILEENLPEAPLPQETALPLMPGDEGFYEELFLPAADSAPPNQELQDYVPEKVRIEGNHLYFTADYTDGHYVSGKAESMFSFLYGSMTLRIKSMNGPGLFPAVWMLPSNGGLFPEVDIYELIGREPESFYGVIHYLRNPATNSGQDSRYFRYNFPSLSAVPEYCTLKFDWTPESMVWTLNGKVIHTMKEHIPQIPMYLILNLAVGGTWCGDPTSDTLFPAEFEVEVLEFQPREIYTR